MKTILVQILIVINQNYKQIHIILWILLKNNNGKIKNLLKCLMQNMKFI